MPSDLESRINYSELPQAKLVDLFRQTKVAHASFFEVWQQAASARFGQEKAAELTAIVYPNLADHNGDLEAVFWEELGFVWAILPQLRSMLTFATYDPSLLPEAPDQKLDLESLSQNALVLLWNTATLTYVMQTNRWVETITPRYGKSTALALEKEVWVDRGAAEEDLRYGLIAAGAEKGDVRTLLRGFQMAPGEVGLVDAEFKLDDDNHGWITHRRCPAHELFRDRDKARLENSCVICVVAMRLSGEMVNEKIRCRAASLPPHRTPTDHACRWEYWIEDN